ncbi:12653_t:CDS:1, partial [Gigaspora rosea]
DLIVSDDDNVDSDELTEDSIKENENQWNTIISQWIEEIDHENCVENSGDKLLPSGDLDQKFLVGTRDIHPAEDPVAK